MLLVGVRSSCAILEMIVLSELFRTPLLPIHNFKRFFRLSPISSTLSVSLFVKGVFLASFTRADCPSAIFNKIHPSLQDVFCNIDRTIRLSIKLIKLVVVHEDFYNEDMRFGSLSIKSFLQ